MNNSILKLKCIKKLNYSNIDYIIKNYNLKYFDEYDLSEILIDSKLKNSDMPLIYIDEIKRAFDISQNIILKSEKLGIKKIEIIDKSYPNILKEIDNSPQILFVRGNETILNEDNVSIVGTRSPTEKGIYDAKVLSQNIDYNVVSGLALGIDTVAHTYSNKSIAVMPCSLDKIYPKENKNLSEKIINDGGCLVSEYMIGSSISRYNFVLRNRIQSGLSKCVIVVECSNKSGTMHTAKFCVKQNRMLAACKNLSSGNIELLNNNAFMIDNDISQLNKKIHKFVINSKDDYEQIVFNI